ncbi:MAG: hypothetical protein ACOYM5_17470 [Caulobacter sp.]
MAALALLGLAVDGIYPEATIRWVNLSLLVLAAGGLLTNWARRSDDRRAPRYGGGELIIGNDRGLLAVYCVGAILQAIGFGGFGKVWPFEDGMSSFFAILGGVMAVGMLLLAADLARRIFFPTPLVVVSEQGLYAPGMMRSVIAWDLIDSLPVASSGTPMQLAINAPAARANIRSVLLRPIGQRATHVIYALAPDASQADLLFAIATFKPALIEALTLPKGAGPARTLTSARTISPVGV